MADRTCTRCSGTYDEEFFAKNKVSCYMHITRRPVCIACEQTARDAVKKKSRWPAKARDALRRHADKFIKLGKARDRDDFANRFNWDVARMAHEAEHTYGNGCPNCSKPFAIMGHGLADITLDMNDPKAPPYYGTNTKWICQTCNRKKGKTDPAIWGAITSGWRQWEKQQEKLLRNPLSGLPLFDL